MKRRSLLVGLATIVCAAALAATAGAAWPERNITIIVPFSAGGSTDVTARLVAKALGTELGQSIIVENRPGAGSNIGAASVARAAPDGYTLLLGTSTLATNVTLYKSMGFDLRTDLIPVSQLLAIPNVLASQHLSAELFKKLAQVEMVHVAYKGGAQANNDLIAGHIQVVFAPLVEVLSFIEAGKVRALAVTTKERSRRLPDLPTLAEALPGYEVALWNALFAPKGTPQAIIDRLAAATRKIMADPDMRKVVAEQGSTIVASTPDEFKPFLASEIDKWGNLVKLSGAKIN
jgi:tripartite-type tricarboxylate transporter receptor subunit TctC